MTAHELQPQAVSNIRAVKCGINNWIFGLPGPLC